MASAAVTQPPETFTAQSAALIVNAFVRADISPPEGLLRYVASVADLLQPTDFSPQAIATLVNSYTRVFAPADGGNVEPMAARLVQKMALITQQRCAVLDVHAIAVLTNGFARTVGWVGASLDPELYHGMGTRFLALTEDGNRATGLVGAGQGSVVGCQELAMLFGGFVKVGHMTPELMQRLTSIALRLPKDAFNARDAVNIAHAISRCSLPVSRPLLDHIQDAALFSRPAYTDKSLAGAGLGALHPLDGAKGDKLGDWNINTACMMVAALARLGCWHAGLFDMLAQVLASVSAAPSSSSPSPHGQLPPAAASSPADPGNAGSAPDAVDTLSLLSAAAAFRTGGTGSLSGGAEGPEYGEARGRELLERSFDVIEGVIRGGILANACSREVRRSQCGKWRVNSCLLSAVCCFVLEAHNSTPTGVRGRVFWASAMGWVC